MSNPVSIGLTVGTQPPLARIKWLTRTARAMRFDVAWTIDHFLGFFPTAIWDEEFSWLARPGSSPHPFFDYQVLLGYLARHAGKMQLGIGVTEPIRRHPVVIAQAFLSLSHMTRRPPILGIGAGEAENVLPYGLSFDEPVARLEEALEVIRLCFDASGPVDYEGRFFSLDGALMDLRAAPGRKPEVWLAAHGPRMLALAGRFADGWYPTLPFTPGSYEASLRAIRVSAAEHGREPGAITPGWQAFTVIGRSEGRARRLLDTRAVRFTALLAPAYSWSEAGAVHPLGADFRGLIDFIPERYTRAELDAAIAAVPVDLVAEQIIWGTPRMVQRRLGEFVDAGLRHIVLQPVSGLVSMGDAIYSLRAALAIQRRLRSQGPGPSMGSSG